MTEHTSASQSVVPQQTGITKNQSQDHTIIQEESFSGPLPHPDYYAKYDAVLPGSAERILKMCESEQQHRQTITSTFQKGEHRYRYFGMTCAFIVMLVSVCGAIFLIAIDKQLMGGLIFTLSLVAIVKQFIQGKKDGKRDDD